MAIKTGPQTYPAASRTHWYQNTFGGDPMQVNVIVLHTTEGTTLPDYDGGATAPNLTAVPDLATEQINWYQHFDIETSSRALVNLRGGVQTNTLNVCQIELVGTCDPTTHKKWANTPHIYWPKAPDWALAEVAAFLRWMNTNHSVPLTGPSKWPAYPSSYGTAGGQRMSGAQWEAFNGICGHMHVPENDHGDPGAIDFPALIALAKRTSTPPEEDDVALTDTDKKWISDTVRAQSFAGVWKTDQIGGPADAADHATNKTWQAQSILQDVQTRTRALTTAVARLTAQGAARDAVLAKLAEGGGLDAAEVQAAAQAGAQAALDRLGDALTKGA